MAKVPLAGTDYIPGVTEEHDAGRDQAPAREAPGVPVDYLPEHRESRSSDDGHPSEPEKISDRRRVPLGAALPLPGGHRAGRGRRPRWPRRRARTSTGSRTSTLLEEDGVPAVFDRYSNSFLKIYFPIPEGREDEIARKVLITHLQSGNSYGIQLKEKHSEVPPARARPVGRGLAHRRYRLEAAGARGLGASAALMGPAPRIVVVGGGVHGLSTAGALARGGAEVVVLEKGTARRGRVGDRRRDRAQLLPQRGDDRGHPRARSRCSRRTRPRSGSSRSATSRWCPSAQVDDLTGHRCARQAEVGYASGAGRWAPKAARELHGVALPRTGRRRASRRRCSSGGRAGPTRWGRSASSPLAGPRRGRRHPRGRRGGRLRARRRRRGDRRAGRRRLHLHARLVRRSSSSRRAVG